MHITFQTPGQSKTIATVILEDDRVRVLEEQAIRELGKKVKIKGFRPGKAPIDALKERIPQEDLHGHMIHAAMPEIMEAIQKEKALQPIARPRVALKSLAPLTLEILFLETPSVTLKTKKVIAAVQKKKKEHEKEQKEKAKKREDGAEVVPSDSSASAMGASDVFPDNETLLELLAEHVQMELASELIDEEAQDIVREHAQRMAEQGVQLDDWLRHQKKTLADVVSEMRPHGEKRLKIRYGLEQLMEEWKEEFSEEEIQQQIQEFLKPLEGTQHEELRKLYEPGGRLHQQFRRQQQVQKILERLRNA